MINGANPEIIQCLSGCPTRITYEDIRNLAPSDMFERYDNILTCRATNADPNFQRCLNPGCNSGQVHDSTHGPIFTCIQCRYRMCTNHDPPVPLHEGQSCAEYIFHNDKDQQNEAAQAEVAKMSVACPECGAMIHKYDGCDYMTC
ncbi:ring finger protein [Pyrenophora tritici-repentis]|uniref:RBR-type E3 ubiquitin transferase n=1 Tax=Pyrenophora tritici-repentis TaxID=45151 RepID=A0A317AAQ7_9PLEO|nr:ring finger protein [Pyrenophora tritici-repentis]KAF7450881.1 ring finger protein [Pyrenophora tritici-repentis]KAF7573546.1 ring finger protein [Pyrenophora tritici-repentis]KAI0571170.1 ring finger protein [Pyrenophora tritici-repentis]KAI0586358.1 ring finger protein [Pyrenophora tritici-repentis]